MLLTLRHYELSLYTGAEPQNDACHLPYGYPVEGKQWLIDKTAQAVYRWQRQPWQYTLLGLIISICLILLTSEKISKIPIFLVLNVTKMFTKLSFLLLSHIHM